MRKFFLYTALIIGVLFLGLLAAPFLFKDKIQGLVQAEIDSNLKAEVYYGEVGLSLIRNFPNARISIEDFGVVGQEVFEQDTLIAGKLFAAVVDIWSVFGGEAIHLKEIVLEEGQVNLITLEDGRVNYDIVVTDSTALTEEETPEADSVEAVELMIELERYALKDVDITYLDESYAMDLRIKGFDHQGKGKFTAEVFDLETYSQAQAVTFVYDGLAYLNRTQLEGDFNATITNRDTFGLEMRDNQISLNQMPLVFAGDLLMYGDDIEMKLSYGSPQTDFRSLMSLVPAVYVQDFDDIGISGGLVFDGFVDGVYNETQMPGFGLNLRVNNGTIQYPDLPEAIRYLDLDLSILNPEGPDLESMKIDLKKLKAQLAGDPFEAKAKVVGLEKMSIDGQAKAKLDLAKLTQMFPMEGTELKGLFTLDAVAQGTYDEAAGTFPTVDAVMDLSDGYVHDAEYPAELTEFNFHGELKDADGALETARLEIPKFHFLLDGEPLDGSLLVSDFNDPSYTLRANGTLDLAKLLQVYPIDSLEMAGKLLIEDFETRGVYSDIEAERYENLPTKGKITVSNLVYQDFVNPKTTVDQGVAVFNPDRIDLNGVKGKLGRSDYQLEGALTNYIGYALLPGEALGGNISLSSKKFDLNEFMEEEPSAATEASSTPATNGSQATEEHELEAFPVPDDLNVNLSADIAEVLYDNLTLKNVQDRLSIVEEEVDMENLQFDLLGGKIGMNGLYNTQNLREPKFNFYLDLEQVLVQEAFQQFTTVQALAPALEKVNGRVNAELGLKGLLGPDLMPKLEVLEGLGKFLMLEGGLEATPMLAAIQNKVKLANLTPIDLKDIKGSFRVEEGSLIIAPIDFKIKQTQLTLGGRQSLTGALDYQVTVDAPSGA
ncbi:MAG: AsmA-like C-terminal region-containing protein, partial [Bacteroidota bacterium]